MGKLDMFSSRTMAASEVAEANCAGCCNNEDVVIPDWKNLDATNANQAGEQDSAGENINPNPKMLQHGRDDCRERSVDDR